MSVLDLSDINDASCLLCSNDRYKKIFAKTILKFILKDFIYYPLKRYINFKAQFELFNYIFLSYQQMCESFSSELLLS